MEEDCEGVPSQLSSDLLPSPLALGESGVKTFRKLMILWDLIF